MPNFGCDPGRPRHSRLFPIKCTSLWHVRLSKDGEAIGCPDEFLGEVWVVGSMASVVNHHQLGTWPHALEFPGVCNGGLKVKATIHQNSGDVGQDISVTK